MLDYQRFFRTDQGLMLLHWLEERAQQVEIYPPKKDWFKAFEMTPLDDIKVVLLGQDPYHQPGQAHGLAFSVPKGITPPPSLKNIFKALKYDVGCDAPAHGDLSGWARQGVLLLNTILTVEQGKPLAHQQRGWEAYTKDVLTQLVAYPKPLVILLWGNPAKQYQTLFSNTQHLVLTTVHPSPLSAYRGFFDCHHFSQANTFLVAQGRTPIDFCKTL